MRFVVLGDPIDHSLSPALHTAALSAAGLDGSYTKRRVDAAGMAQAVAEIRAGELTGANVTMPHKELAAELVDRLSATARRCGAVNTLVSANGVVGHNTDVAGIQNAWREAGLPTGAPVVLLGAGGAAAAALVALDGSDITVSARRPAAAAELVERTGVTASVADWGEPVPAAVVVNATPIGMGNEELPGPIRAAMIGLFDMAYAAVPTPAVAEARSSGLPVADGPSMLLHQAAVAFELWTGHRAPLAAMRSVIAT